MGMSLERKLDILAVRYHDGESHIYSDSPTSQDIPEYHQSLPIIYTTPTYPEDESSSTESDPHGYWCYVSREKNGLCVLSGVGQIYASVSHPESITYRCTHHGRTQYHCKWDSPDRS